MENHWLEGVSRTELVSVLLNLNIEFENNE
jgi:hypothetical protein